MATITLRKNTLMRDGICIYEDEYGNSVFMQKDTTKDYSFDFVAKLRFKDKNVKAKPLNISIPIKEGDEDGAMLHLDYLDGVEHSGEDIDSAIEMYTLIVQRWINLMYDMVALKPSLAMHDEGRAKECLEKLAEYEELSEAIGMLTRK